MRHLFIIVLMSFAVTASADTYPTWRYRNVLVIGDSLIAGNSGFMAHLRERFAQAPASLFIESEIGARPSTFSKNDRLHELIKEHKAESVIIVLGMNTLRSPPSCVRDSVKNLLYHLRGTECFWVGPPPLVEGGEAVLKALPDMVQPACKYYNTYKELKFPPNSVSGFHVKRWKGKKWAQKFLWWVESQVPFARTVS